MNNLHVLFVDDHADTRFVFSRLLTMLGHKVSLAATAVEALAVVEHERPDLAILDLGLPAIEEGLALLESLTNGGIRCVVCSGYGQTEDICAATSRGSLAFIVKPTTIAGLVDGIDKAMSAALPWLSVPEQVKPFRVAA